MRLLSGRGEVPPFRDNRKVVHGGGGGECAGGHVSPSTRGATPACRPIPVLASRHPEGSSAPSDLPVPSRTGHGCGRASVFALLGSILDPGTVHFQRFLDLIF